MTVSSSHITLTSAAKSFAGYTLLPGFWSRLTEFAPRFGMIAYYMALIFEMIKLLPKGHALLNPAHINKYRIRDVLGAAANNLHGGLKNIDQYIVFGMFLIGTVILVLQFAIIAFVILSTTAQAAVPFIGMFVTVDPRTDMAHLMLDKVFGIPDFFNSCFDPAIKAANAAACTNYFAGTDFPNSFQTGLQALFRFYSMGMLAVAGFVVFYYIIAMILETVNTGVPFGKRFQSIFTPIRLVMAIVLLLPLSFGYNTGQYIILQAAKWGSALATNSWLMFNNAVGDNPMGMEPRELVAAPKVDDIDRIVNFFYLAQSCKAAYKIGGNVDIKAYMVRSASPAAAAGITEIAAGTTFSDAMAFTRNSDIKIVFGEYSATEHSNYPANVKPLCGVMVISTHSRNIPGISNLYSIYFNNIRDMWHNPQLELYGSNMACILKFQGKTSCAAVVPPGNWDASIGEIAGTNFYITMRQTLQATFLAQMNAEITNLRSSTNAGFTMDPKILSAGWGGGGLWFDKVVSFNGAFVDAVMNLPNPVQFPMVMEHVGKKKSQLEPNAPATGKYSMTTKSLKGQDDMSRHMSDGGFGNGTISYEIAEFLSNVYKYVYEFGATNKPKTGSTDNSIRNMIKLLFGETGLFDFRANSEVFPLAKLAMLGREILNKTVVMLGSNLLMSGANSMIGADLGPLGEAVKNIGPGMRSFAIIGITLGVLLYYVLPLMPFIYFFFAVGRWVKSIFEAMVAIPLWALAHLRLGGEGIPGPAAGQGYFLILEIFLRPILTLFGLLASIGSFMALSFGLDSVFNLAVMNAGGFDMTTLSGGGVDTYANSARDGVDALFYTVLYAILVYMISTSSFKLIDLFPNAIMRWGGSNTAGFNDQTDPIGMMEYNMVYKVDALAREVSDTGQNFDDATRTRATTRGNG